jgi:hypothetical protein
VIDEAESCGCWENHRHNTYPTHDLPVSKFGDTELVEEIFRILKETLMPAVAGIYGLRAETLSPRDVFVVKYDASEGGQRGLEMHEDGSEFSFNVLLSNDSDFDGGGTVFEALGLTLGPKRGEVLIHAGRLRHAGAPITSGQRYVLVGFVNYWAEATQATGDQLRACEEAKQRVQHQEKAGKEKDGDGTHST